MTKRSIFPYPAMQALHIQPITQKNRLHRQPIAGLTMSMMISKRTKHQLITYNCLGKLFCLSYYVCIALCKQLIGFKIFRLKRSALRWPFKMDNFIQVNQNKMAIVGCEEAHHLNLKSMAHLDEGHLLIIIVRHCV